MIFPEQFQTTEAVAAHYDELDRFYRDIWGEHVHHGYWATGRESPAEAAIGLVEFISKRLQLAPGQRVCDIGCGYGATARFLAERHQVWVHGVTVSAAQVRFAQSLAVRRGQVSIQLQDWLDNDFVEASFDRAYGIESSEHMPDKQRFFDEAFRILRPGGLFVVCAWLARNEPRPWEIRYLLEPICREGRLPSMGNEVEYRTLGEAAGFRVVQVEDISDRVSRTWWVCIRRAIGKLISESSYRRFLLDETSANRIFAATMLRLMIAYRTRSMRYCVLVFMRDSV